MPNTSRRITLPTTGITLSIHEAGPPDGSVVVLLHGFPEPGALGWRHQIGPLAAAGFRVVVPDQRGYGGSEKPSPVSAYALDTLAADVLGLIEAIGRPQACLVGHDWGGIVAWWTAIRHPERVARLAILNAPHPTAFRRFVLTHPTQLARSWYAFAFQLPVVPESGFRRNNWRSLARGLVSTSRPGTFPDPILDEYRRAWSEPGAIRSMIHWYRAALRHQPPGPPDPVVRVPTRLIWGVRDRFIDPRAAEASLVLCERGELVRIDEATHWVQHEEPERVNRLLREFLAPAGARDRP